MKCRLIYSLFIALSVLEQLSCKWNTIWFSCTNVLLIISMFSIGFNLLQNIRCKFYECCQEPYVRFNLTKLEHNLNKHLFGQPLVKNTLINALKSHFSIKNPKKALVLSFHGSTGVGKNFVSQFIAESLFAKGIRSKYYKQFISTKDFPHNDKINEYKVKRIKIFD